MRGKGGRRASALRAFGNARAEGIMRCVIAVLVVVQALVAPAVAAPGSSSSLRSSAFTSHEEVLKWMYEYRKKPELARVPDAILTLSQVGAFKEPETSGVYVGFLAGIIGANPSRAEELVTKSLPMRQEDHWALVRAVAYSGLPEWKALLVKFTDRMPARRVMIEKYVAGKLPTLNEAVAEEKPPLLERMRDYFSFKEDKPKEMALDESPEVLDTLWGYYFATGVQSPILRIIAMLSWAKEKDNVERLTVGNMAKFTLASNASRDTQLLGILKDAAKKQPKAVEPILLDVIDAAETAQTARIRKEALAAIEEIKRKGPGSKRQMAWWGQVGEGAVALGCIAAAALGQVEFGLPCVVGGAVSSAALRFWSSP
jgi:hypothetical protein